MRLSEIAFINPDVRTHGKEPDFPISFIPMEAIDEIYSEITCKADTTIKESSGFTKFEEGDLLWGKITPCMQNGKSAIAKDLVNGIGCGSTEFFVIRPKNESVLVEYLHIILHMKCVRDTAMLYFAGTAGQQRVSKSFLENFNIPLPPVEKQLEMTRHVYNMRSRAKQLRVEGAALLEKAKKDIENILLGIES